MSHNFVYGDIVRIGKGKVEYTVAEVQTAPEGSVTVQSNNTGKFSDVDAERVTMVQAFVPQAPTSTETNVSVELVEETTGEAWDPREDRRQSAYGLSILAAVMRKNPNAVRLGVNPFKPIGSTRAKVRAAVKAKRTAMHRANEAYNTLRRNVA